MNPRVGLKVLLPREMEDFGHELDDREITLQAAAPRQKPKLNDYGSICENFDQMQKMILASPDKATLLPYTEINLDACSNSVLFN
jgi:hypothetical protein